MSPLVAPPAFVMTPTEATEWLKEKKLQWRRGQQGAHKAERFAALASAILKALDRKQGYTAKQVRKALQEAGVVRGWTTGYGPDKRRVLMALRVLGDLAGGEIETLTQRRLIPERPAAPYVTKMRDGRKVLYFLMQGLQ